MNFTESFEQFSSRVGPTDLALYAGVALVLWVIFGDKLGGLKSALANLFNKVSLPKNLPSLPSVVSKSDEDLFFKLVESWKRTRDLAVKTGCSEAVKVADQMFPFLSPVGCKEENKDVK